MYIEVTFKIITIGYYQLLIIGGFLQEIKGIIAIFLFLL